ncbi:MAG: hypothetical protein GC168_18525 [Candidatus Hydrogenedens sp.]|nr:hypothetical protein [Candidatus Hydrogenedens sp.]
MRIGVINTDSGKAVALELGDRWIDASRAWKDYHTHVEGADAPPLAHAGDFAAAGWMNRSGYRRLTEFVQRHGRLEEYLLPGPHTFAAPVRPGKVIAIGRNYAKHAKEMGNEIPDEPMFFNKLPDTIIGPGEAIVKESWAGRVDFEGEIAVMIGVQGRNIAEAEAKEHVAGYTLLNDISARDLQNKDKDRGHPWTRAKNMDTFCPVGPVVVFRDALSWPFEEDIETRVNSEVRQQGNTQQFLFPIPRLIAHVSRYFTLYPGDLIATGTPEGVGPLNGGDVVEVASPGIGVLSNPVVEV